MPRLVITNSIFISQRKLFAKLGTVRFNDIGAYKNEWAARSREWRFEKARQEETHIIRENDRDDATLFSGLTDLSSLSRDNSDTNERWWRKRIEDYLKNLSEFIDYCKTYEQPAMERI